MNNIEFYEDELTADYFNLLRDSAGWGQLECRQIEKSLKNTLYSVVVKSNDTVIGMGRLVGDGVMYWYIQDVIVLPEYQGKKIGTEIINRLLDYIQKNSLHNTCVTVGLMAAKGKETFYKKFDFIERPNTMFGAGMIKDIFID